MKRVVVAAGLLAAGIVLAGCAPEPGPTPTPTRPDRPTPTSTPTPTGTATGTPTATPSPTSTVTAPPDAAWTAERAYEACVAFQLDRTESEGYDPDAIHFDAYADGMVRQNGAEWVVDLSGTVADAQGTEYQTYASCTVGGTPASPRVEDLPGI